MHSLTRGIAAGRCALVTLRRAASAKVPAVKEKVPSPKEVTKDNAVYDEITHTGQGYDQADYRLSRFELSPKQVNPNVAADLVAEHASTASEKRVVFCDGGTSPALGHPRVYINLDRPGTHACQYCGAKFHNVHTTQGDALNHHEIQV